jgi:hypothetical protein
MSSATPSSAPLPAGLHPTTYGYRFPKASKEAPGQFAVTFIDGTHANVRLVRGSIIGDEQQTLAIVGHRMTFSHGSSAFCAARSEGTYRWRIADNALMMTLVDDTCRDRARFMTWRPLVEQ